MRTKGLVIAKTTKVHIHTTATITKLFITFTPSSRRRICEMHFGLFGLTHSFRDSLFTPRGLVYYETDNCEKKTFCLLRHVLISVDSFGDKNDGDFWR